MTKFGSSFAEPTPPLYLSGQISGSQKKIPDLIHAHTGGLETTQFGTVIHAGKGQILGA